MQCHAERTSSKIKFKFLFLLTTATWASSFKHSDLPFYFLEKKLRVIIYALPTTCNSCENKKRMELRDSYNLSNWNINAMCYYRYLTMFHQNVKGVT